MATLTQIIRPVASLSVGTVTILTDPAAITNEALIEDNWKTLLTYTFPPSDVKNKAYQMLEFDISWDGLISAGGTNNWRVLLNDVAINSQTPKGSATSKSYEMTTVIIDYAITNTIKIQAFTTEAGIVATVTNVVIGGRALTYV